MIQNRHFAWMAVLALLPLAPATTAASVRYTEWSAAENVGPAINSAYHEQMPSLSKDGLSLYFTSNRPCGEGDAVLDWNIWVARRVSRDAPWHEPECLAVNVDGYEDSAATFSRDGHWMFFVSDRPGSLGTPGFNGRDIWLTYRENVHDDAAWQEPSPAADINTAFAEAGPSFLEGEEPGTGQLFFTSNRNGTFDLWVADVLAPGVYGAPRRIDDLSTDQLVEARPSIRHDGLELFFFGNDWEARGQYDIFAATRADLDSPWSARVKLGPSVNGPATNDQQPFIAADRETLFFVTNRAPGYGGLDVWVAVRTKVAVPED